MTRKLWTIKSLLIISIGILFLGLENVIGIRRIYLIGLFSGILVMSFFRYRYKAERMALSFIIDGLCVLIMGLLSRYVVNYYLYILYMLLLAEASYSYDFKWAKYPIFIVSAFTLYHYYLLWMYRMNLGTLSEIVFLILIDILLVLTFVLARKQNQQRVIEKALNLELVETNKKLEKLTRVDVKNQIAREIHDTFGHDMMGLIMEIEMAHVLIEEDPAKAKEMLDNAKKSARSGMKTIRKVVETLRNDDDIITETLQEMVDRFASRIPLTVDCDIDISLYEQSKKIHDIMYRLVQECMTNSVRHADAKVIYIHIEVKDQIHFLIKDDGKGFKELNLGYGLTGMKERVQSLGGHIEFENQNGFLVKGYL